jgi:hypothetical protein
MQIKVLITKNGVRRGEILEARELIGPFGITGYQCVDGPHTGQIFQKLDAAPLDEIKSVEKVKLPPRVAEALEFVKKASRPHVIVRYHIRTGWTIRECTPLNSISEDTLIKALYFGYTIEEPQTFQTQRKLTAEEIRAVRRWYEGALKRLADGSDPDGFAKEAVEEVALYLGGAELLKDVSAFCKTQLGREQAQQSG